MGPIKTILLTGATGYLGSNLAEALVSEGYRVIILKRSNSDTYRLNGFVDSLEFFDIDGGTYDGLFENNLIDCVIHNAASYGKNGETLTQIYQANLLFPTSLIDACVKYGVKYFLNTGTSLPSTLNHYALSKNQFSAILEMNKRLIKGICIKLEYFYGPGDDSSKFISLVLGKLLSDQEHIDLSEGIQLRDFIYIKDAVAAYLLLVKRIPEIEEQYSEISLGSGKAYALREVVEKLKFNTKSNAKLNFGVIPTRSGDVMFSQADLKYFNALGWQPLYDIDKGIIETINLEKLLRA